MAKPKNRNTVEYKPIGSKDSWIVSDWKGLIEVMPIVERQMPGLHKVASGVDVAWPILRMRFGINPMIPPADANQDDFRIHTEAETCAKLNIEIDQIGTYICLLGFEWEKNVEAYPEEEPKAPKPKPTTRVEEGQAVPEVAKDDIGLLEAHGFTRRQFEVDGRTESQMRSEMRWMAEYLRDKERLFSDPMVKDLARQSMVSLLHILRIDDEVLSLGVRDKDLKVLLSMRDDLQRRYQDLWKQIEEICPFVKSGQSKHTFVGVVSDLVEALRAAKSRGQFELIDGLFTSFELQVMARTSIQSPDPRYRPGWAVAVLEAKRGLWDPKFKRTIPMAQCRKLDEAYRLADEKVRSELQIALPDLERDDEKGEFDDLFSGPPEPLPEAIAIDEKK